MDIAPRHCLRNVGAKNSYRYDARRIENFLGNMGAHVSCQELPFSFQGFGIVVSILGYLAKTFDDRVRTFLRHCRAPPLLCPSMRCTNSSVFRWAPGRSIFLTST